MQKIKSTFEEIKGLKAIAKMYNNAKIDIKDLEEQIAELKKTKLSLDLSNILKEISQLELELLDTSKEIECEKILNSAHLSISELKTIISSVVDSGTCLNRCIDFSKNLFVTFNISNQQANEIFAIQKEEECFKVLKISKEVEDLFKITENRSFSSAVSNEIRNILQLELTMVVPYDLSCFINDTNIFLVYPTFKNDEDEFITKNTTEISNSRIYSLFPKTFNIIFSILKKNLSISLIDDQYSIKDVELNNSQLVDTPYHIKEVDEWVIDLIIKEITIISKNGSDSEKLFQTDDQKSSKFISESYSKILKLQNLLFKSNSLRKQKGITMFSKSVVKFFNIERCETIKDLFVCYSDISHFTKKFNDFQFIDQLSAIREDLFYRILTRSTTLEIDLDLSILMLKAKIKQKQFDFEELLDCFIPEQTNSFFKVQFFEKLFNSFVALMLKPKKLNQKDKSILKELSQYLMDISYGTDCKLISNFGKVASICKILDSSLETVIDLYESDDLDMQKSEIRALVRILFDDSKLRENFIEQLM